MQKNLLTFILLYSLTACGNNKEQTEHHAKIAQEAKAQKEILLAQLKAKDEALKEAILEAKVSKEKLLVQEKAKKEAFLKEQIKKAKENKEVKKNEKLSKAGILIEDNLITIDTNKTKDFFKNIGKTLEEKLKKITSELEKGMLDEKNVGVQIDESHINIDLNKTKDFLKIWSEKMQGFVKEFDNMAKELDTNSKPTQ